MDLLMKLAEAQDHLRAAERRGDDKLVTGWKYQVSLLERLTARKGL